MQIRQLVSVTSGQLEELCALLGDAVDGGASVGFLAPLSVKTAIAYWQTVLAALPAGLALFVAEEGGVIVGSVQLAPCAKENGRHRAEIQKLFVLRSARGKGIATQLLKAAESLAVSLGRILLVLDTHEGSRAESLYVHLGWQRAGSIPGYAACPDGSLHPTVYYYKQLVSE